MENKVYVCRHGETEWSLSGQHTSFSDIPLTENGENQAKALRKVLEKYKPKYVLSSPLIRAKHTAELAGMKDFEMTKDLVEWQYGDCEGKTTKEIQKSHPNWEIFDDGPMGGESVQEVGARADRLIQHIRSLDGDVAIFSHGHFSRVFSMRWIELPVSEGKKFPLSTASLCILGFRRNSPVIDLWNDTHHWSE
ncbi:MAG: histidine phosphatase family protein [Simkaniaceae bacterium]|nr:histidine phosphatase family protein [Simkaniaceae bacterium]